MINKLFNESTLVLVRKNQHYPVLGRVRPVVLTSIDLPLCTVRFREMVTMP